MLSEKRMRRKGDVTISTVILIVLGLAVLVMLIIGFTKGWDFFFGLFDSGPSELQTVAKACVGYAQASLGIDYCKYRLIDSGSSDELVNCNDARIKSSLDTDGVSVPNNLKNCANNDQNKQSACEEISESKRGGVRINGGSEGTCGVVVGIAVTPETLIILEGEDKEIQITLSAEPQANVKVSIASSNALKAEVVGAVNNVKELTFTTGNWNQQQTVKIKAKADTDGAPNTVQIALTAPGIGRRDITVTIQEPSPAAT